MPLYDEIGEIFVIILIYLYIQITKSVPVRYQCALNSRLWRYLHFLLVFFKPRLVGTHLVHIYLLCNLYFYIALSAGLPIFSSFLPKAAC
jgi:hypothetical protein